MKLLSAFILAFCVSATAIAAAPVGETRLQIMTYNQYLGGDLEPLLSAGEGDFNAALLQVLQQVAANDFQARARAQARLILDRAPLLVGLQEVWAFACVELQPGGQACEDPSIAGAFTDHLVQTLAAIEKLGGEGASRARQTK